MIADETDWAAEVVIRQSVSQLRMKAHEAFDPIWQTGLVSRSRAYRLLAAEMGLSKVATHFKRMSPERLRSAFPAIRRLRARLEAERSAEIGRVEPFARKLDIRPTAPTDNRPSFQPSRHK